MLPSFLGIVAQGGDAPPPPAGVLVSNQALDLTKFLLFPGTCTAFVSAGKTYVTDGTLVTQLTYSNDTTNDFTFDATGLTSLESLNLQFNSSMSNPPIITGLTTLTNIYVAECPYLTSYPNIGGMTSLTYANFINCPSANGTLNANGCSSLTHLLMSGNTSLTYYPDVTGCSSLANIDITGAAIADLQSYFFPLILSDCAVSGNTLLCAGGSNEIFNINDLPYVVTNLQGRFPTMTFNYVEE